MNIDIKSVLIGVLLTTSIMLVMAFDDHEKEIGRYQFVANSQTGAVYVGDTTTGKLVSKTYKRDRTNLPHESN